MERLSPDEKLLLYLLRDDVKNAKILLNSNRIDFNSFFSLLESHYLPGVMCLALLERHKNYLNMAQQTYCKMRVLRIIEENRIKKDLLANASYILHKEGISVLVIKGPALDFSKKKVRFYNDLDVLIPKEDLLKAVQVLESNGYEYQGSDILTKKEKKDIPGQLSWNNQYQFRFPGTLQEIEVHINLFERKRVRFEDLDALLDNIEQFSHNRIWHKDVNAFYPCPEASLALLCLHTALKRSPANNTFILRQAYDMKKLVAQGIDWEIFMNLCKEWHIYYYAYFSLRLQEILLKKNDCPILTRLVIEMTRAEKRLARIHLACFNNFKRNSLFNMFRYRVHMPYAIGKDTKNSIKWYFRACFPQKAIQAKRYGISERSLLIWCSYLLNPFRAFWLLIRMYYI